MVLKNKVNIKRGKRESTQIQLKYRFYSTSFILNINLYFILFTWILH